MRKLLLTGLCLSLMTNLSFGQCLNAALGQYPSNVVELAQCAGSVEDTIAEDGYASDYSALNVYLGNSYTFSSSIATDYITISNAAGTVAYAHGVSPVNFTPTMDETVRFYSHVDAGCTENNNARARKVLCSGGIVNTAAGPCLNAPTGMWPTDEYNVSDCSGSPNIIDPQCYAGDYSKVFLVGGHTYGFESSVATDWITITDSAGTTVFGYGPTPLNGFVASGGPGGVVRFYTHTDSLCGEEQVDRSRIVTCIGNVGLSEIHDEDISLYPNPANDKISIAGDMTYEGIELISVEGRVLKTIKPTSATTEIDVASLVKGTYFVRIKTNGQTVTKEFVKN